MSKPRLAIVIGSDVFGGAEQYVALLAQQMLATGYEVAVVGDFDFARLPAGVHQVPVQLGPKWSKKTMARSVVRAWSERRGIMRALDEWAPDVVHAQFKREQLLITRPASRSAKVVWTEHGVFPSGMYGRALTFGYRRAARRASSIICVSSRVESFLSGSVGIDSATTVLIENVVDERLFRGDVELRAKARADFGFASTDMVLLTLSRLEHAKGVDRAIEVLEHLPANFRLLVVGSGAAEQELRTLAAGLGTRVVFAGFTADVRPALNAADVFLLPSRAPEGMPLSILEARAAGLKIVVTKDSFLVASRDYLTVEPKSGALAAGILEASQHESECDVESKRRAVDSSDLNQWTRDVSKALEA